MGGEPGSLEIGQERRESERIGNLRGSSIGIGKIWRTRLRARKYSDKKIGEHWETSDSSRVLRQANPEAERFGEDRDLLDFFGGLENS